MLDASGFVMAMQKMSQNVQEAGKPVNVEFGTVISITPLQISVDQKMILGVNQLILSRDVTNYTTTCTISWTHESGTKQITINNALKQGERVILLRLQEGQQYLVLDRVGGGTA